jgi:ABC-type uncharacterized transport system auxiliary subunit
MSAVLPSTRRPAARLRVALIGGLLAPLLAGCVSVQLGNEGVRQTQLVLQDAGASMPPRPARSPEALLIQAIAGDPLAETRSIVYARTPSSREFYQLATWTEPPLRAVPRLLQRRLETRGSFASVSPVGQTPRAGWLLTVAIEAIVHEVAIEPGSARFALRAELFDRRTRSRVALRDFAATAAVEEASSAAAAAAMGRALADVFDQLVPWLEDQVAEAGSKRAGGG